MGKSKRLVLGFLALAVLAMPMSAFAAPVQNHDNTFDQKTIKGYFTPSNGDTLSKWAKNQLPVKPLPVKPVKPLPIKPVKPPIKLPVIPKPPKPGPVPKPVMQ